jgi:hypothetical protein
MATAPPRVAASDRELLRRETGLARTALRSALERVGRGDAVRVRPREVPTPAESAWRVPVGNYLDVSGLHGSRRNRFFGSLLRRPTAASLRAKRLIDLADKLREIARRSMKARDHHGLPVGCRRLSKARRPARSTGLRPGTPRDARRCPDGAAPRLVEGATERAAEHVGGRPANWRTRGTARSIGLRRGKRQRLTEVSPPIADCSVPCRPRTRTRVVPIRAHRTAHQNPCRGIDFPLFSARYLPASLWWRFSH